VVTSSMSSEVPPDFDFPLNASITMAGAELSLCAEKSIDGDDGVTNSNTLAKPHDRTNPDVAVTAPSLSLLKDATSLVTSSPTRRRTSAVPRRDLTPTREAP
jgi:hypothetical protein